MEFNIERFGSIIDEVMPLLEMHHKELWWDKDQALDIDLETYYHSCENNRYPIFTARDNGKLIGYSTYFVQFHVHHKSVLTAIHDVLFVLPEYRGKVGKELLQYSENELKNLGVNMIMQAVTPMIDFSPLLKRMGYKELETLYVKRI